MTFIGDFTLLTFAVYRPPLDQGILRPCEDMLLIIHKELGNGLLMALQDNDVVFFIQVVVPNKETIIFGTEHGDMVVVNFLKVDDALFEALQGVHDLSSEPVPNVDSLIKTARSQVATLKFDHLSHHVSVPVYGLLQVKSQRVPDLDGSVKRPCYHAAIIEGLNAGNLLGVEVQLHLQ